MFCPVHKWFISRNLDTGRARPKFTDRHILHCASCRSFTGFSQALTVRSARDLDSLLRAAPTALHQPDRIHDYGEEATSRSTERRLLRPALALFAVLLLVAGVLFIPVILDPPSRTSLDQLAEWNRTLGTLEKSVFTSGTPLEKEYLSLKKTVAQTTAFLRSQLDINLD